MTLCDRPSPEKLLDSLAQLKQGRPRILLNLAGSNEGIQTKRCSYMAVQTACTETLVMVMALLYGQVPASEVINVAETFITEVSTAPLIMFKIARSQIGAPATRCRPYA